MRDIFITKLDIHKVRHLKNLDIPLSGDERKHLILTGENGSGKTSVLEEIRELLTGIEEGRSGEKTITEHILKNTGITSPNMTMAFNYPDAVVKKAYSDGDFVISYFETARTADFEVPGGVAKTDIRKRYKLEDQPGNRFVQHIVNLKADQSFARDDNDMATVSRISGWFESFESSLREIFEDDALRLEFDRKNIISTLFRKAGRHLIFTHFQTDIPPSSALSPTSFSGWKYLERKAMMFRGWC